MDNWPEFDGWCCVKGVDPLDLPSYRFYNLATYYLKEGKDEEQLEVLEQELVRMDREKHPLHNLTYKKTVGAPTKKVVEEIPVEEKYQYIPSWWKGDHQNYATAKKVMMTAPKSIGEKVT